MSDGTKEIPEKVNLPSKGDPLASDEARSFSEEERPVRVLRNLREEHSTRAARLRRERIPLWEDRIRTYVIWTLAAILFYPLLDAIFNVALLDYFNLKPRDFGEENARYSFYLYLVGKVVLVIIPYSLLVWSFKTLRRVRVLHAIHEDKAIMCAIYEKILEARIAGVDEYALKEIFSSVYSQVESGESDALSKREILELLKIAK